MPTPKLTGLLNNCALNSALPPLLEGFSRLAVTAIEDYPVDDRVFENYELLKKCFAIYYGIQPEALKWSDFKNFLDGHSFYAKEIILAPVFRSFIAEKGPANGYHFDDLHLLKDVQDDGRYNLLHARETAELFHRYFGISLESYAFEDVLKMDAPIDNYRKTSALLSDLRSDFFGDVRTVQLYLKGHGFDAVGHFELQPHESMEQAAAEFLDEINNLPQELSLIHEGLSTSQHAHETNQALGSLVVYVRGVLNKQSQIGLYEQYILTAEEYATLGKAYHNDTPSGNHTFAVILLTILWDLRAQNCLDQMTRLSNKDTHSSRAILNYLSKAIIEAKGNLEKPTVVTILAQAEALLAQDRNLVAAVDRLLEAADTLPPSFLLEEVVLETTRIRDGQFTPSTLEDYRQVVDRVSHEPGWGHRIAGLMLAVLGLALIVASALILSGGLGLAAAPALPAIITGGASIAAGGGCLYAGIHFFRSGIGKEPERNEVGLQFMPL